jgi:hypothetical protein
MIIHNPKISGSLQFPSDENGNLIALQVQNGTLETITLNSSGVNQNVQPSVNYSGSFTGSFVGDGSSLTGVSAINIDALGSLGGATIAQGDNLVVSDAGTEKKVTFSNLEDSVFGNVSGDITIAAGGASTLASIANSKLANSSITIDGSAISLGGTVTTTNTQLSTEAVQDIAGALVATGGTKTGIAVTYQDGTGDVDFVVTFPSQTDENFTTADHSKLDGIEASADVTDATNVTSAGALMDTELTDLAGVKGVTISTLQPKPSEGAFENGDKTKLDGIAASANNYVLPTNLAGDDVDIDTTVLSGATVISDLDINITTNTSGLVTDANGSIATRDLTKSDLGLGNVDNTADSAKPVSTAGQTALDLKANLASPSLTGNPTAPTQADNDDSTKIATTAYVQREVSDLLGGAPAAFDTLLEISASIANGDSDVVALTTTVGTKLAKASNLSDLANASTSRTNLGVDAAGTDNSTNVTLVTDSHDYLSISGQAITLGSITNDDLAGSIGASKLAGSIGNSKLSNSSITIDGSAISLGGSVSTLQLGTSNSTALAGDTTTISGGQASAITANTAKNTNVSTDLSISGTTGARTIVSSDGDNAVIPIATTSVSGVMSKAIFDEHTANNAKTGITSGQASAITANTAKNTNVSTNLSISGTTGARTIASSDGTDAIIPIATTSVSGLLSPGLFDEIDANTAKTGISGAQASAITANTAKVTNVSTDLSKTTAAAQITINSSDGDNVVIGEATTSIAGLMSTTHHDKLDGIEASADVTDATNVAAAGALMDSEVTDLAGVKGVTISTLQVKPSEGAFADGDKTKLDAIEAGANVTDTANVKSSLNASLGGSANIGDGSDTITIPGDLVVTGTTTTENVTTLTTSNGIVFEGSVADEHEATLLAGTLSADRTLTLPNATGTIALTSDLASVGDGGLTQNNFTNADHSKLNGIEASATADQTASEIRSLVGTGNSGVIPSAGTNGHFLKHDGTFGLPSYTTNTNTTTTSDVTSAGALMDSEVTNLAEVKAFDSTDYATSAQGTKADAALPKGGGAMTGAITTNSTFDGRDVATDGTKLDGIESNATADQTAAQIRTLVGTGNGNFVPSAGSSGEFLKHDGTFGTPSYTTNTDTNTQLTQEQVEDFVGGMLDGTETGITVGYDDTNGNLDFVVASQTDENFTTADHSKLDGIAASANNYVLPTNLAGDDIDVDTGALSGATVISDLDFNITTNTSGLVTDANGSVSTRTLTLANLGYTGATDANNYVLPTNLAGDDIDIDTNALTGATVISDLDINITTNTSGLVTDANASVATRTITATDLGLGNVTNESKATMFSAAALTGNSTAVTQAANNNSTRIATTAYVQTELTDLIGGAPGTLDTLNELAAAIDDDASYASTLTTALATKLAKSSNLSDVASASTSRTNLGVGSGDDVTFGTLRIDDATASTTKTTGALIVDGGVGIAGALNVGGDVVAFASSDERLKDNIELISNPIEKVQSLKGVTWDWNSNADELQQSLPNVGVIAQDVEKVLPQLVTDRDNGFKGVDYAKLTGLLIEAVKDQQKQIDELKSKLS